MSMPGVSVILLTWNGEDLLKECLNQVYEEVMRYAGPKEFILVDNGSKDQSVAYVRENFPDINIIEIGKNKGFAKANNIAVKQATYDYLLFLNNDLKLEKQFIENAVTFFDDEKVFAVAPKILRWDRETLDDGIRYGVYERGLFDFVLVDDLEKYNTPHKTTFFCGACFICRKDIFLALGCFDELFTPYAYEDLDLAYNAWKRGYKVIYNPKMIAFHKREATTRSLFSNFFFITLMWRNKFIFMWKNLTFRSYFWNHLLNLPVKLVKFTFNGRILYVVGFFKAMLVLPLIIRKRITNKQKEVLSDKEVLETSYGVLTDE